MRWFKYGNESIGRHELLFAIPSTIIGVGILSLPRQIAKSTVGSDGWILLLVAGVLVGIAAFFGARLAMHFPNQSFLNYASKIVTKPIAIIMLVSTCLGILVMVAYEVRGISNISKEYLFERTPTEVIALCFLLVVVYAVSGSRAGLLRLNMLFLPIILFVAFTLFVLNIGWFHVGNLLPMFETGWTGYKDGFLSTLTSYMGYSVILFYIPMVQEIKMSPKMTVYGMALSIAVYLMLYITCIGVFGNIVTENLTFPTIDLAKKVIIPGGFFERFESLFFIIWIMAIFNTVAMLFDVVLLGMKMLFRNLSKMTIVLILSPIIYFIAMLPENIVVIRLFATYLSYYIVANTVVIIIILYLVAKLRKVT